MGLYERLKRMGANASPPISDPRIPLSGLPGQTPRVPGDNRRWRCLFCRRRYDFTRLDSDGTCPNCGGPVVLEDSSRG